MPDLDPAGADDAAVNAIAASLEAEANRIESQPGDDESVREPSPVSVEPDDQSDPYEELDEDNLKQALLERDKKLAEAEKQYKELQSLESKHFNEQREREAQLRERIARIEALSSKQPEPDPEAVMDAQRKFDAEWSEKVSPGDPEKGQAVLDLFRGMMGEYLEETKKMVDSRISPLNGQVRELNPVVRENKDLINALTNKGIDEDQAVRVAEVISGLKAKAKPATQTQRAEAPGAVAAPTRSAQTTQVAQQLSIANDPVVLESLKLANFSDKEIANVMKQAAKEYANAS